MTEKKTILIVDDAPENIHFLREILKDDYAIVGATTGKKALEQLKINPQLSLVLMDVIMPEMDGLDTCKEIKSNNATKDIPVIFITGSEGSVYYDEVKEAGGEMFLTKPVEPDILMKTVKKVIG